MRLAACIAAAALLLAGAASAQETSLADKAKAVRALQDDARRVKAFRALAEAQAKALDRFGFLDEALWERRAEEAPEAAQAEESKAFSKQLQQAALESKRQAVTRRPPDGGPGYAVPPVPYAERLAFDGDYVRKRMPEPSGTVKAHVLPFDLPAHNIKLVYANGRADFMQRQGSATPTVAYLEAGVATLPQLFEALRKQGDNGTLTREADVYLLRKPLIVGPEATLLLRGSEVRELRMSVQRGAYLVNAGTLFAVDTRITGWNETDGAPAWANYAHRFDFRPFLLSWSQSATYLAGSTFTALGYANSKSYGLTISAGPTSVVRFRPENVARPQAVIVENSFRNLYYGFYCFEADDIALIGNEYVDNVVYGIDPHDYSNRLSIAYNTSYGAQKKHGIIISREVNDSLIFGNLSFGNRGSGIMVERESHGTLVYANSAFDNAQDGLSVFESSCSIHAANLLLRNGRKGINIRNSHDVGLFANTVAYNAGAGIQGYRLDLHRVSGQRERDFEKDPYSEVTAFSAVDNLLESNGFGIQTKELSALYLRGNRFVRQSPRLVQGDWSDVLPQAFAENDQEEDGVMTVRSCSPARENFHHACGFRRQGYFLADGQAKLGVRLARKPCSGEAQP